ncbi:MAG: type II secretion system F family protein [Bacilli bacterium]|nr:type II secretion system F family protein [Bacilli bacterium]
MSKRLLRFCVLIYKGITFIMSMTLKGAETIINFFKSFKKRSINKAKKTIEREKLKQKEINKREQAKLKKEISREEAIALKEQKAAERKQAKLYKIEQKRRKKLELKAERQRKKLNKIEKKKLLEEQKHKIKKATEKQLLKEQAKLAKIETKIQAKHAKELREEEVLKKQLERENIKKLEQQGENISIKKITLADKFHNFVRNLNEVPNKIRKAIREKWNKTSIAKNKKNKLDLNRKALLIEFEGKDAERSNVKIMYEYLVKDKDGKIIKGYADGYSKVEIHSYLLSEGYDVYSIKTNKWIRLLHSNAGTNKVKIKNKDLIFFVTQLSTYLKSGITLIESLKILLRQYKNKKYKKIFKMIIYDLSMGENFSTALENRGIAFPNLLITMTKSAEMTGELPEVLDDMADYYTETEKTRKQMITAMMYPSIVFVFAISVLTFIMVFVIPKFVGIYDSMEGVDIPKMTQFVIDVSNFTKKNIIWIGIGAIVFILIFRQLFIKVKSFRTFIQWCLMHIPVISNIIIYKEVTMFTKTFASLLAHNVYITDSMEILSRVTKNEIYRTLIFNTVTNLARGERLSAEFEGHWAFPIPAYEMIITGERTGQLPEMMSKVSAYYQELHQNSVTRVKTFIEPILIVFLTAMVGVIVLSIVLPMFNMYQSIQQV